MDVIARVRRRISDYQAILYILQKPENSSRFIPDPHLLQAIDSGDVAYVRRWFATSLDSLSISQLRDEAKRQGVHPVFGLNKSQLILAIMQMEKRNVQ